METKASQLDTSRIESSILNLINTKNKASVSNSDLSELLALVEELDKREEYSGIAKWFRPDSPYSINNLPKHAAFIAATRDYREILLLGGNRCLLEGTLVATPTGPVAIEKIAVGDVVYDCYGNPTTVTATWDNGEADVVSLSNRGKEWVVCTPNHELDVQESRRSYRRLRRRADNIPSESQVRRVFVKSPLGNKEVNDSYALGAFLGDGCSKEAGFVLSSEDSAIPQKIADVVGCSYKKLHENNYSWRFDCKFVNFYSEWCSGRKAHEKQCDIAEVKSWSRSTLLNFVAGLHDTDGCLTKGKDGYVLSLSSQSLSIIEAYKYAFLALWQEPLSVGIDNREKYVNGPCYTAYTRNPHSIKRICEELQPFLVKTYKADCSADISVGKRSYPDKLALKIASTSRGRVYDITVEHPEHFFLLANGLSVSNSGKTSIGAYIASVLATGLYPDWWDGVHYDGPVEIWACGKTGQSTRDTVQEALMGRVGAWGTGMIPAHLIGRKTKAKGTSDLLDVVEIIHTSGKISTIGFKTYKQDAPSFYGSKKHLVWLDEPCPEDIYNECLIRTSVLPGGYEGRLIHTITPKEGLTRLLADFLASCDLLAGTERLKGLDAARALMKIEAGSNVADAVKISYGDTTSGKPVSHHRAAVAIGWDDIPWMSDNAKREILESTPPHLRETVSQGIPSVGDGAVYAMPLSDLLVRPQDVFQIPPHYKKVYGLDVGWNTTAAIFGAEDPDTGVVYIYGEHYGNQQPPEVHAARIKAQSGEWQIGLIDPAANQKKPDGKSTMQLYRALGLRLKEAENTVESGIMKVWSMMTQGKLKIFPNTTPNLQNEYLVYRRDDGKIVKKDDHAMDALRYMIMGLRFAKPTPTNQALGVPGIRGPLVQETRRYNV